jgi:hypothetical protein
MNIYFKKILNFKKKKKRFITFLIIDLILIDKLRKIYR